MDPYRLQESALEYSQLARLTLPEEAEDRRGLHLADQVARGSRVVLALPLWYWNSTKVFQTQVATPSVQPQSQQIPSAWPNH